MARPTGLRPPLTAGAALLMMGCVTVPHTADGLYRPANAPENGGYGYAENRNADGSWTIQVRMPAFTGDPMSVASAVWRRRAAALCGGTDFRETIFRAERLNTYDSYNHVTVAGDFLYAGYAACGSTTAPAAPGAATAGR